jgi:hypothetical protein
MRGDGSLYSGRSVVSAPRSLTGTISVTNAVTAVVGVGTAFTTEVQAGDWVKVDAHGADMWTEVASVTDATNIVLSTGYLGATTAGAAGSAQCAGALTATTALTKYVDPTVSVSVPGTGAAYTRSTIDALTIGCAVRKN